MSQSALTMGTVMKDIWTDERLQNQFDTGNAMLARLDRVRGVQIGQQAQVPIRAGRAGSFTSVGPGGGQLNPATAQPVNQALYTLPYNWFQIELETSALAQTGSNAQSVISAKDLEIEGAVENAKHQISRMMATNGDGIVAACASGGPSTTIALVPAASEGASYGAAAVARGWLPAGTTTGQYIDVGTTADTDALVTGQQITAAVSSPTAPSITTATSVTTVAGTHFVYIANPNSTTAANPEVNGLRQIVGSGAFGGLNPATAGQEWWKGALVDTTTTTFSLDLALGLQSAALQAAGQDVGNRQIAWTSIKQRSRFYALLQSQVQFAGDQNLAAGSVSPRWNGQEVEAFNDILDTDWFFLNLDDLIKVTAGWDSPKWASDIEGSGGALRWRQGFTSFLDACVYPIQLGARRRSSFAAALALK